MTKFIKSLIVSLGTIVLALLLSALCTLPVWLLWDYSVTPIFPGVNSATFLQTWGLTIICSFLFKSTFSSSNDD